MKESILIAGAGGALGQHLAWVLKARGHRVRALVRSAARARALAPHLSQCVDEFHEGDALVPTQLAGVCRDVQMVISCLGASIDASLLRGRLGFPSIDTPANRNLIGEATAAGVRRFAYVSLFGADRLGRHLDYVRAHELVVQALQHSGLAHVIVRPTGFFSAFNLILRMAALGLVPSFGDPGARTNPIHEADLAQVCADALLGPDQEVAAGGPEVLSRQEITELAFAAVGRPPRSLRVPGGALRATAWLLRPLHPRLSHLLSFFLAATSQDLIAPARGVRTLGACFQTRAFFQGNRGPSRRCR